MSPETIAVLQAGGACVGATALSVLGCKVGDMVGGIVVQRMDDWADNEARKMPPLVIIYPTEPHVLDFDSAFPG